MALRSSDPIVPIVPIIRPIVHYQFGCNEEGKVEIVESGPLMKELMSAHHHKKNHPPLCHLSSNGIVSTVALQSNATIQELQDVSVDADAFAIELWLTTTTTTALPPAGDDSTMTASSSSSLPILSFRDPNTNSGSHKNDDDDCAGVQVSLALRGLDQLELRYVDRSGTQTVCRVLMVRQRNLTPHTLQQVVVIWRNNGDTSIYWDGLPMVQGAPNHFDTTLSLWDPMSTLQLFGSTSRRPENTTTMPQESNTTFGGSINMLSIYNQVLTETDVTELYQQGQMILDAARRHRPPLHITVLPKQQGPHVQLLAQGQTWSSASSSIPVVAGGADGIVFEAGNLTAPQDWALLMEITTLPFFGSLFVSNSSSSSSSSTTDVDGQQQQEEESIDNRLKVQQRLWLDLNNSPIWYRPNSDDFFNAPSFSYNGTSLNPQREFFHYRILAVPKKSSSSSNALWMHQQDPDELVLATSEIVEQELIVIHVNHPPLLKVPEQATVYKNQPTGLGARPKAHLGDVQVLDAANDWNIDRIRVDLWALSGTLSLASDDLPLADFASCRASERQALLGTTTSGASITWSCHGNGRANRNMTFLATPDNASTILSHVEYHGFRWDQADEFVIRLSDGVDGSCLSQKEHRLVPYQSPYHKYHTIHNDECFEVLAKVPIPPISMGEDPAVASAGGYLKALFDVGDFGLADGIFWGFFLLATTACCLSIRACIRCCGARGSKIHIEDEDEEECMEPSITTVMAAHAQEVGHTLV